MTTETTPTYRCSVCNRDTSDEDYVNVRVTDGSSWETRRVCWRCYEQADVGWLDTPLDMTVDSDG